MNALVKCGYITELNCGSNFSYILKDDTCFLTTEYKILQSQLNGNFVKCIKMLYNGQIQLFYYPASSKSFTHIAETLCEEDLLKVVRNLIETVVNVRQNGFLTGRSIDGSLDKIFVDPETYQVLLVYIPVAHRLYEEQSQLEMFIRAELHQMIAALPIQSEPKINLLVQRLSDEAVPWEALLERSLASQSDNAVTAQITDAAGTKMLRIVAVNAPDPLEIVVTKDQFVIGKKAELCDGVIGFSKLISRTHCMICRNGLQYTVVDLGSLNGTFLNGIRLQPNHPTPVKDGDVMRLANSDFRVYMTTGGA